MSCLYQNRQLLARLWPMTGKDRSVIRKTLTINIERS